MRQADGRGDERGFTLIEVIVVLVIISLISGLLLSRGPLHSAVLDMRQATGTVASALRIARARAIAANRPVGVLFDTRAASLAVAGETARTLPRGIRLAVTVASGQGLSIVFLPDGSSTGGQVDLAGEGRAAEVGVSWLTGRVSVSDAP